MIEGHLEGHYLIKPPLVKRQNVVSTRGTTKRFYWNHLEAQTIAERGWFLASSHYTNDTLTRWWYFLWIGHISYIHNIYDNYMIDNLQVPSRKNLKECVWNLTSFELFWRCLHMTPLGVLSRAGEFYSDHRCSTARSCHCTWGTQPKKRGTGQVRYFRHLKGRLNMIANILTQPMANLWICGHY